MKVGFGLSIAVLSFSVVVPLLASAVQAQEVGVAGRQDLRPPATRVKEWLSQAVKEEPVFAQVSAVTLNSTASGLDIVLVTVDGKPLRVDASRFRTEGNALIADIPAVLGLADGQAFKAENPTADIATVTVEQLDASMIRVSVVGKAALPETVVTLKVGELAYGLNPENDEREEEVVATGEQQRGYRVPNASTATKTDTPLRDIPQSIQVVPKEVLRDQGVTNFFDALRNIPGVSQSTVSSRGNFENPVIRGFTVRSTLRDGLYDDSSRILGFDSAIVDRIEVLKGPASVLYGQGGLGGTINYITKQPLSQPFYEIQGTIGSFDNYRGAVDLTGPLNADKTLLYRLNLSAQTSDSFVDFLDSQRYVVAPKLTWKISDRTTLNLKLEYIDEKRSSFDNNLPAVGTVLPNPNGSIPRNRFLGEPAGSSNDARVLRVGYDLEHRFSENWKLRSAFQAAFLTLNRDGVFTNALLADNRTVTRSFFGQDTEDDIYSFDTYVVGKFKTGSIEHQLVAGVALSRTDSYTFNTTVAAPSLDVFNPIYGRPLLGAPVPSIVFTFQGDAVGFYLQDQISLLKNLKILLGGRFDIAKQTRNNLLTSVTESQQQEVFSPRVGIVYQPIPAVSLYASYSESFLPTQSVFSTVIPQPERGTQYELGIKADLSPRLAATLAFYDLARTNVFATVSQNVVIQTGKQRSRGIEFDLSGEILPGWNIFAGYAYTDARIEEDRTFPVGNILNNVPTHSFNLWTSYEVQRGTLKGLGFGLGLFYAGERQGDLLNTFQIPDYLRTDAAIFYKRGQWRAQLNFKNLFDVDYFESAVNRTRVSPGEPFTVQGTVSWAF